MCHRAVREGDELGIVYFYLLNVAVCCQYIDMTITQMSEAWEDILLEMDSKLKKLAEDKYVCFYIFPIISLYICVNI